MILISHRGNLNGRIESYENEPNYIDMAISKDYDVEVDVWYVDGVLYLGHDKPNYSIDFKWFIDRIDRLWIHCKNIEAVAYFRESEYKFHFFWHQEDDITLTSFNFLWTFPSKKLTKFSIAVLPEFKVLEDIKSSYGICSDYVELYR